MAEPGPKPTYHVFSGNIYIFHAFNVGSEIDLEKVKSLPSIISQPLELPKYFRKYHVPLAIDLPHPHTSSRNMSVKLYDFGALSLTYKIPFEDTFENVRKQLEKMENQYKEQSVEDAQSVFRQTRKYITHPNFFNTTSSYLVIQVDHEPKKFSGTELKKQYGGLIASAIRFETETLSELQKNEILEDSIGYFRGDLVVIDDESAFVYDPEYEEMLSFFEFANIQLLELQYFSSVLDQQLNMIYKGKQRKLSWRRFLPFASMYVKDPVEELGRLKVDISVITERLENTIRLAGEPYFSELYDLLEEKLDLKGWRESIDKQLDIILDIRSVLQHKVDSIREDLLTVLIIILIFIELLVALLHYFKG